jgi:NADH:ubiquinone oxidoreductase subunit 5 (subunit L)/multisubunit Na+/H+ antiporter MnhA subunit
MEAPTPASALIHSSTLVVMGIFMLLRLNNLFLFCTALCNFLSCIGAITIAYGAIFSILTSDLKKAVAYSTISQIGYLICGCGFLAIKETLYYLIIHAVCKALLFVMVGYLVHFFGGTTSLRKMGGIYFTAPFISICMFILCISLAGAPYTVGYLAKDFLILHFFNTKTI